MSYPKTLDEMPIAVLVGEILKRRERAKAGRCPYCNGALQPPGDKAVCQCRFGGVIDNHEYYNETVVNQLRMT